LWKLGVSAVAAFLTAPALVLAQGAPTQTEPEVSLSGYVQPRYDRVSADGETRDTAFLRRAVVAVKANLSGSWNGELQLDAGPPASRGERLLVKDAVLRYTGWAAQGLTVAIGNQKMPFSQSSLQSASRRSHVERPFTGNSDFGAPGRSIGVRADGWHHSRTLHWAAALASSHVAPEPELASIHGIAETEAG
jgi:phosphate-selective porin